MLDKFFKKGKKADINPILKELENIRQRSEVVALYGSPTGANWLGIANASRAIFGKSALEIPQEYSNPILSEKELQQIAHKIISLHFSRVVLSGFADYFFDLATALHKKTEIDALFHGTFSECNQPAMQQMIGKLISYSKKGTFTRLAFVRKGLAETISALYGVSCYHQQIPSNLVWFEKRDLGLEKNKIHIGVFGGDTFNKNIHNQVVGALLVHNSIVHVQDESVFTYLNHKDRIRGHGKEISRDMFLNLLANMTINLYLSFSESWGLVALESASLGVPCIIKTGSSLSGDLLYPLAEIDSPEIIAKTIKKITSH